MSHQEQTQSLPVRIAVGTLAAMLAVSGVYDLLGGALVDGLVQVGIAAFLFWESIPRRERGAPLSPELWWATVVGGCIFLVMRTFLRS